MHDNHSDFRCPSKLIMFYLFEINIILVVSYRFSVFFEGIFICVVYYLGPEAAASKDVLPPAFQTKRRRIACIEWSDIYYQ